MPKKRTRNRRLTDASLRALQPGKWATESLGYGFGALQVRKADKGPRFFYRYTFDGAQYRIRIPARNAETGKPTTLAEARTKANALGGRYQSGEHDLKNILEAEQREADQKRRDKSKAEQVQQERETATLGALLSEYVAALKKAGKHDQKAVENALRLNVERAFPDLWNKPAADVSLDDVLEILERITEAGNLRTAGKVRSYIRAAYSAAINAGRSAQAKGLRRFKLRHNPAAKVRAIEGGSVPRDRALSVAELRAFWQRINEPGERFGPLLRFYLLTGGQRFRQLARAKVSDIADEGLILWDGKGKRKQPRRHVVPLLPEAVEALEDMASPRLGEYVLTLTNGQTPADHAALFKGVKRICEAMQENGEAVEKFTIADIRRTIETRLAALRVPLEVRGQLQSHGMGGIQARHYDRHDYSDEKREALESLRDLVTRESATVDQLQMASDKRQPT